MAKIFRTMRKDPDDKPTIGATRDCLGVRVAIDVDVDSSGNVELNGKGMSVSPGLDAFPHFLVPRRLQEFFPRATGSNSLFCFAMGDGPFVAGIVAQGLVLIPDSPTHGVVTPEGGEVAALTTYQANLAATREEWKIDEAVEDP